MVERFTEQARRAMVLAADEARNRGHEAIGPEHLLLGILREGTCLDRKVLERIRVRPEMLQAEAERALSAMAGSPACGEPVFSPELKAVLETAFKLRRRSDGALGAEHLMLGLLASDGSAAGRIMRAAGAEFETACRMGFLVRGGERGFLLATSPWLARPR
jgi:ATP-dependent Clp protease ATP-binding subunit ClpC